MLLCDGIPTPHECTGAPNVPLGTLLPTARAYQVLSLNSPSPANTWSASPSATRCPPSAPGPPHRGSGTALLLINVDSATTKTVPVSIKGRSSGASVSVTTYGKTQYDDSKNTTSDRTGPVDLRRVDEYVFSCIAAVEPDGRAGRRSTSRSHRDRHRSRDRCDRRRRPGIPVTAGGSQTIVVVRSL